MNRRNFIASLGLFTVLPSASTYKRIWKEIAKTEINPRAIINPEWVNAPYEIAYFISPEATEITPTEITPILFKRESPPNMGNTARFVKCYYPIRLDKDKEYVYPFKTLEPSPS